MAKGKKRFVDFKEIKTQVSIQQVLEHYGTFADLEGKDVQLRGCCPIHNGDNERQFTVNLDRNIWHCFGDCKTGGNTLDFVAAKEGVGIRDAALKIADWFSISTERPKSKAVKTKSKKKKSKKDISAGLEECGDETVENPIRANQPLSFNKLKNIEYDHEALTARALFADTAEHFGVGYCTRGIMRGKIAIPIHNAEGGLLAYAGVSVDDPTEPYKWPDSFQKELEIYNIHRAAMSERAEKGGYTIVTNLFDVFQLYEAGRDNVLALLEPELTDAQLEKVAGLPNPAKIFILYVRSDKAGVEALAGRLARIGYVHIVVSEALETEVAMSESDNEAA